MSRVARPASPLQRHSSPRLRLVHVFQYHVVMPPYKASPAARGRGGSRRSPGPAATPSIGGRDSATPVSGTKRGRGRTRSTSAAHAVSETKDYGKYDDSAMLSGDQKRGRGRPRKSVVSCTSSSSSSSRVPRGRGKSPAAAAAAAATTSNGSRS
ncbi:hypothetical protein EON66_02340, partial [archaeon]